MCETDYWHWRYQTFFLTEVEQELNFSLASQELVEKYQDLERRKEKKQQTNQTDVAINRQHILTSFTLCQVFTSKEVMKSYV